MNGLRTEDNLEKSKFKYDWSFVWIVADRSEVLNTDKPSRDTRHYYCVGGQR